jgi:hypothetical protein
MCWETDYRFFAEQKEKQVKQERRTQLIDQLLKDANQKGDETKVEEPQAKEQVPSK